MKYIVQFLLLCWMTAAVHAVPVLHIHSESQDGKQLGKQLARQIAQHYPRFAQDYDQYLTDSIPPYEWSKWLQRAAQVREALPRRLREEIDAVAQSMALVNSEVLGDGQLSAEEFWVVQILLEQDSSLGGAGFGVLNAATGVSGAIVGYNQYGLNHPALLRLRAITVYQNGSDEMLINIGFAGFSGVLSGYNSDGLFVAYLPSPQAHVRVAATPQTSIALHLRGLLENNDRINQALPGLLSQAFFTSHNLLLADNGKIQVLEQALNNDHLRSANTPLRTEMQWQRAGQIAVVDCFVMRQSPNNCHDSRDIKHWQRLRELAQFSPQQTAGVRDVQAVLQDRRDAPQSLFTHDTLYSSVFLPLERRLFLYSIGSQSASGLPLYREVELPLPHRYTVDNLPIHHQTIIIVIFVGLLGILLLNLWSPAWLKI